MPVRSAVTKPWPAASSPPAPIPIDQHRSAAGPAVAPSPKAVEFLYLDQEAVLAAGVLDMRRAMEVVGHALAAYERGQVRQPSKVVLRNGEDAASETNGRINGLCALLNEEPRSMGMKWVASFPHNRESGLPRASALIILNSPETGFPVALMDGTIISATRTGACTGLGAQFLAPRNTRKIGIVGAGVQARTQLLALHTALPQAQEIAVWNRTRAHGESFVAECQTRWNAPVWLAGTMAEALTDADVVLTITTADEPIIPARYIKPGALTIQLSGHECEFELVKQCCKIVVNNWDACKYRGIRTPAVMYKAGLLRDEDIYCSLGDLLLGRKPGRETEDERIHFTPDGMGLTDVALAYDIYQRARAHHLGQSLRLWNEPLWY
jgi:ornithine cyclodeaminase/alanine dehydrogenase-like protein (mu-crystallin family)